MIEVDRRTIEIVKARQLVTDLSAERVIETLVFGLILLISLIVIVMKNHSAQSGTWWEGTGIIRVTTTETDVPQTFLMQAYMRAQEPSESSAVTFAVQDATGLPRGGKFTFRSADCVLTSDKGATTCSNADGAPPSWKVELVTPPPKTVLHPLQALPF